jgi:hypothetical protein
MPDRIATMMIVQSLQEIREEIRAIRAELHELSQSRRVEYDGHAGRELSAPLVRFPAPRRTTSSS